MNDDSWRCRAASAADGGVGGGIEFEMASQSKSPGTNFSSLTSSQKLTTSLPAIPVAVKEALAARHRGIFAPWEKKNLRDELSGEYDSSMSHSVTFGDLSLTLKDGSLSTSTRALRDHSVERRMMKRKKTRENPRRVRVRNDDEEVMNFYENIRDNGPREVWKTLRDKDEDFEIEGKCSIRDNAHFEYRRGKQFTKVERWAARRKRERTTGRVFERSRQKTLSGYQLRPLRQVLLKKQRKMLGRSIRATLGQAKTAERKARRGNEGAMLVVTSTGGSLPKRDAVEEETSSAMNELPIFMRYQSTLLRETFSHTVRDEKALRAKTKSLIDKATKGLPLALQCEVFSIDEVNRRVLERFAEIMKTQFVGLEKRAWKRWIVCVRNRRLKEIGTLRTRDVDDERSSRLVELLNRAAVVFEHGKIFRAFRRWTVSHRRAEHMERDRAARVLQRHARGRQTRRFVASFRRTGIALRMRRQILALHATMYIHVGRCRQIARLRGIELDRKRERRYRALQKYALLLQTQYRLRLARLLVEEKRRRHYAALRVQCAWRCKQGRLSTMLLRQAREERLKIENAASVKVQRIVRGFCGRFKARDARRRRDAYRRKVDAIQATWKDIVERYVKKRNRVSAMNDADADCRARWVVMVQAQNDAATTLQRCFRRHRAVQFVGRRRRDWNESARKVQFQWRKLMEIRRLGADYQKRREQLIKLAAAAQSAMILWINLYPEEALKMVGALLEKDPSKIGFYEVSVLERAAKHFEMHHRRMLASIVVQRVYRGLRAKFSVALRRRRLFEARKRSERLAAEMVQKTFRGLRAKRWVAVKRAQDRLLPLIRQVSLLSDLKELCRVLSTSFPTATFDCFDVVRVVKVLSYRDLWWDDVKKLDVVREWAKRWSFENRYATIMQRIFRGHASRIEYANILAAHVAAVYLQKCKDSATKIEARMRGVHARRTFAARAILRRARKLDRSKYPHILTPAVLETIYRRPETFDYREILQLRRVVRRWHQHFAANAAALRLQRVFRGTQDRNVYRELLHIRDLERKRLERKAATMLQRVWRGRTSRKDFSSMVIARRTKKLREDYMRERQLARERERWAIHLKTEERRLRQTLAHKKRIEEQKLRADIEIAKRKARHAQEMVKLAKEEQTYAQDLRVLNAWRQRAETDGRVYYTNEVTGETTYCAPPHWRYPNNDSKKLLFWKNFDDVADDGTQTMNDEEQAICRHCNKRAVTRECNQCISRFCVPCYTKYHRATDAMKSHTYKTIDAKGARTLKCIECETLPATRKCEQCDDVYCRKCYQVVHSRGHRATHKYTEFKPGSMICVECDSDFATVNCEDCGDVFCSTCSKKMHSKGEMAEHKQTDLDIWVKVILQEGEEYCTECSARVADRVCDQCGDPFCATCFKSLHSKGLRKKHTWKPYDETGLASGWQEYWDADKKKYVYFNTKTKESQTIKPIELMALAERQKAERMQREEMQKQKMEEDIRALETKLRESGESRLKMQKKLRQLEKEKEKRQKVRTAIKNGYRTFKMKFMIGKKRRKAQEGVDEEYLRETVLDKEYTKDAYKSEILKELSEDRAKLRQETFIRAKKDKERLKREELAAKLNDEADGGLLDDELLG